MLGDDLVSIVSSAFNEDDDAGGQENFDDDSHDVKYDPNAVKAELTEFDEDESQIDDAFLRSINCDDDESEVAGATGGESKFAKDKSPEGQEYRRSKRNRRIRLPDPLSLDLGDDFSDEDWTSKSSKKRKPCPARFKGRANRGQYEGRDNLDGDSNEMTFRSKKRKRSQKNHEHTKNVIGETGINKCREESETEKSSSYTKKRGRQKKPQKIINLEDSHNKESSKNRNSSSGKPRGRASKGRRKKVSEMTEEEREVMKAKWREEARLKRERQRQRMTPEEREEYLRRHREQRRMQRAMQKITMTEEEREEYNRKARERKREKRSQLTVEEKRERAQRVTIRRIERLARMSEEEKSQYRMNNYMSYMARVSRMSQEEIEERKQKRREYARKRLEKLTEEDREKRRQKIRQYRWNMDPTRKERFLKQLREGYRRRVERLKAEGKWDEVKEKWRKENKEKKQIEPGTPQKKRRVIGARTTKQKLGGETSEERSARLREQRRRSQQKAKIKKKLAIQQMLEKGMTMEEINRQIETPEQRERRLMKCRINKAKQDLRKRLLSCGAPPEEIQVRLNQLAENYQPARNFRPYKARPETWKPIEPDDLKLLSEEPPKPNSVKTISIGSTTISAPIQPQLCSREPTSANEEEIKVPLDLQSELSSPQYINHTYAVSIASPTEEVSSCSYVSAAVTPEPQLNHYATQSVSVVQYQPCLYPNQQYTSFPATIVAAPNSQSQPVSLHHIIDTMNYQEVSTSIQQPPSIMFHSVSKASDYASSQDVPSPRFTSPLPSPEAIPKTEPETQESTPSLNLQSDNKEFSTRSPSSTVTISNNIKRKRGRPRKGDPPVIKPPKKGGRRIIGQPIGALHKDVNRDAICDECGNAYNSVYLQEHKRNFHNPNYKNGECTICGEKFKQSRNFYKHFREKHNDKKVPLPSEEKKHMCEGCGRAFQQEGNMRKHWYYMHGPGRLSENFHKCHLCPGEKCFKQKLTLLHHFKRCHPGYNPGVYKCSRCVDAFPNETQLNEHVQEKHPEAYWPCQYCRSVKYSELGLKFHYSNGCLKIPKEEWVRLRKEIGDNSIERIQVKCEFCDRVVGLMNLKRHYWELHNVEEEKFPCFKCDKKFKRREYLGAHIVDYHNMQPNEWIDQVRLLNVADRSKVEVKNLEGKQGGAPFNPLRKPDVEERIRANGGKVKRKGAKKKKVETGESSEESESDDEEKPKKKRGRPKGKLRKSKGLTDGESDNGNASIHDKLLDELLTQNSQKKSRGRPKKIYQRKMAWSEEEDSDVEYVPPGGRRSSRGSGRTRHKESEEDSDESEAELSAGDDSQHDHSKPSNKDSLIKDLPPEENTQVPGPSKSSINPVVPLSSAELENVVKTEVLSDNEDVHIAWIYKE